MARFGKLGWFLGLIFGAVVGVLFAPRKGKELRAKMKQQRKKGELGIAPLRDDLKHLGRELALIAKSIYSSEGVQDIVEKGRTEFKKLSDDFVGDVADFHYTKIKPLRKEVSTKVEFVKGKVSSGRRAAKQAHKDLRKATKKAKKSVKIGKKAYKDIKKVLKKKDNG